MSCVEEDNETGACSLENETAYRRDQHKQCKEEIALMRYELQRHSREMELKLERKLSEFIVQMGTLIRTHAREFSRDETANQQLKEEVGNISQTIDLHSQKGNEDKRRTEDSDQEDSYLSRLRSRSETYVLLSGVVVVVVVGGGGVNFLVFRSFLGNYRG